MHHGIHAPRLRLVECAELVNAVQGRSAHEIFGSPDDLKFHSSMTLFASADLEVPAFRDALTKYFEGAPDQLTSNELSHP